MTNGSTGENEDGEKANPKEMESDETRAREYTRIMEEGGGKDVCNRIFSKCTELVKDDKDLKGFVDTTVTIDDHLYHVFPLCTPETVSTWEKNKASAPKPEIFGIIITSDSEDTEYLEETITVIADNAPAEPNYAPGFKIRKATGEKKTTGGFLPGVGNFGGESIGVIKNFEATQMGSTTKIENADEGLARLKKVLEQIESEEATSKE